MSRLGNIVRGIRDAWGNGWTQISSAGMPSGKIRLAGAERPAENVVDVFAALEARCECIRQVPLRVSDGNDNLIEGGDLVELLARPNQFMDAVSYVEAIESYLALYDVAYIAKVAEVGKRPDELIPLNPKFMQVVWGVHSPTGTRVPLGWIYYDANTGGQSMWDWESIIPIIGFNPHAPFAGLAAVTAGKRSILQDIATREQNLAIFTNGGVPDLVLETAESLSKDQGEELLSRWSNRHTGIGSAHKTAILSNGLKANKLGLNPEELQAFQALKFTTVDICKIMRVMPAMLGEMMGETGLSQGSSTQEQVVSWWMRTGLGELARIATAHQIYLVDKYNWTSSEGRKLRLFEASGRRAFQRARRRAVPQGKNTSRLELWYDLNQIEELVEHRLKRTEQYKVYRDAGYTPDDINDYLDLGLPAHPTNVGILPFSVQDVQDVGAAVTPAPKSDVPPTEEKPRALAALDELERMMEERAPAKKFASVQKSINAIRAPMEKQAAKKYSRFFVEQRGRVLDRLKTARSVRAGENIGELLNKILPKSEENEFMVKLISPLLAEQMKAAWENTTADVAADPKKNPFEVDDPDIQKAIEKRKIQATKVNDTTEDDLRKILADSIEAGDSATQIGDAIAEYYSKHQGDTAARPMTAARTQVNGIINDSRLEKAKAVGGLRKGWLHGSPNEPRPEHEAASAKYMAAPIPLDEKFIVGGEEMDGPGDASAGADQTANCTCMTVFFPEKS